MPSRPCHYTPADQWTFWRPVAADLVFVLHLSEALSDAKVQINFDIMAMR